MAAPLLNQALLRIKAGEHIALIVQIDPMSDQPLGIRSVVPESGGIVGEINEAESMAERARTAIGLQTVSRHKPSGSRSEYLILPCGPRMEAWVFGAGHIAEALSPLLARLGWRIVICDDRPEYASRERFPDAGEIFTEEFSHSAARCATRRHHWIILVTRGHQHDEQILRHLAASSPRYIGMIGSKRRVEAVTRRMRRQDIPVGFLDSIHAPIGIPIGADSPAEIAVSIVAEMITVRRGIDSKIKSQPVADTSGVLSLWERIADVQVAGKPAVLAMIVARRGSTPRGLGAQMAVFADGSTSGTIGGGCGEEDIKRAAKSLLLSEDRARLAEVDLTGDPASETALDVCGGRYTVLLERMSGS